MQSATPSHTALRVALRRAAHQLHDVPLVFRDPLAVSILSTSFGDELRRTPVRQDRPFSFALRASVVARSRYAEENLALAVSRGITQYVILGAGLDTFAYRSPFPALRVFEVDHPATQRWKRRLLQENGIAVPNTVNYAPLDFESQSLAAELTRAGYHPDEPAFFSWLGVVPYLTLQSFRATAEMIAAQPAGSGVLMDYGQPRSVLPPVEQQMHDSLAARVAQAGEPFRLFFTPKQIAAELHGFGTIEDLGAAEINARYFSGRSDPLQMRGVAGRLLCAWR